MAGRMLSTREAAEFLGLNEKKVYSLARAGRSPAVRLTGKWLFPQATLAEWLEGRARQGVGMGAGAVKEGASPPPAVAALVVAGSDDPLFRSLLRDMNLQPSRVSSPSPSWGAPGGSGRWRGGWPTWPAPTWRRRGSTTCPSCPASPRGCGGGWSPWPTGARASSPPRATRWGCARWRTWPAAPGCAS
ncbi:MAG: helix-turn-helix domain-containing protein [Candidatus Tectomicrobia bacterium]|nr:helix-turn-helix domain-containing protein [Candidatus Tectomicrobia bacterium]